jgi:large subunit ribosomal protein L4
MVSALSLKFKTDKALVLDAIKISSPKTKEVADIVKSLKVKGKSLFVLDSIDSTLIKGCSNLKNVSTAFVDNVNPYDLMVSKNVIFTKKSVKKLEERYK